MTEARGSTGTLSLLPLIFSEAGEGGAGTALLDIGGGDGALAARLHAKFSKVLGIDIDPGALSQARTAVGHQPGLECCFGDAGDLSKVVGEDSTFDCILSVLALHHMDVNRVLCSLKSHLRAGGRILVVDIYANHKQSFYEYVIDQFLGSSISHPSSLAESAGRVGFVNAVRYLAWRFAFSFSGMGRTHVMQDLSRGLPPSLDEWRDLLEQSLPGGSLVLIVGSTFVFRWSSVSCQSSCTDCNAFPSLLMVTRPQRSAL